MQPRRLLIWQRLASLYQKDIWHGSYLRERSFRGALYAFLRILSITLTGLNETRATSRAAALSFNTLLGLAPLIGIAVLVASFAIGSKDTTLVTDKLNELIRFIAPQIAHYEDVAPTGIAESASKDPVTKGNSPNQLAVNPELINFINNSISATKSSAGGVVASVSLIVIVLLLFTSVEQAFNDIWGVRRGRSWLVRIVSYWTILTLGAVLFFGAIGALSAATFLSFFKDNLGNGVAQAVSWALPALSMLVVVAILTLFYRFIPNTHVAWRAAFAGGVAVALLLVLNNLLVFSYFRRVDLLRSLYGPLAMLPILMFGLYVFWLFVLVGGQISYAVQNVHFRNSQAAWGNLSGATRERLTLIVFLTIARRFLECAPACSADQLSNLVKVPTQVLNECLNRLIDLALISPVPPATDAGTSDYLYQPARSLNRVTLGQFKQSFENFGNDPASDGLGRLDPVIEHYEQALATAEEGEVLHMPLDELLTRYAPEIASGPHAVKHKAESR